MSRKVRARSERRCKVGADGGLGLGIGEAWDQVRSSREGRQGEGKGNSVSTARRTVGGPKAALGGAGSAGSLSGFPGLLIKRPVVTFPKTVSMERHLEARLMWARE